MTPLYCAIFITPQFGAIFMFLSLILANSVLKFPHFRCHGNEGRSGVNFSDMVKLPDLDNPLIGATFLALCLILAELWLILCENFQVFVAMATGSVGYKFQHRRLIA